ncbi:hypothetical protein, partial [Amycolatopsis magusensis]|uniref:hypothetical protein n=1 Tax=Amycolatopsis magusensis TaxID=882444 RepID=UPI0024A81884
VVLAVVVFVVKRLKNRNKDDDEDDDEKPESGEEDDERPTRMLSVPEMTGGRGRFVGDLHSREQNRR